MSVCNSSGVIWEQEKRKKRFKAFKLKHSVALEENYQRYLMEVACGNQPPGRRNIDKTGEVSRGN